MENNVYKPWAGKFEVEVKTILTKLPKDIVISSDPLLTSEVLMKSGYLNGANDGEEELREPEIQFGDYFILNETDEITKIVCVDDDDNLLINPNGPSLTHAALKKLYAKAQSQYSDSYSELLAYFKLRDIRFNGFTGIFCTWENDSFKVAKEASFSKSLTSKAILAEKELGNKIKIFWHFSNFNEFAFKGKLVKASLETQ
jgi:hypothetical protein